MDTGAVRWTQAEGLSDAEKPGRSLYTDGEWSKGGTVHAESMESGTAAGAEDGAHGRMGVLHKELASATSEEAMGHGTEHFASGPRLARAIAGPGASSEGGLARS